MSQTTEVKRSDVIRVVLQFLKECELKESFQTLQRESKTTLNIVDRQEFTQMVMNSEWDGLFKNLNYLMPSHENLFDLYELIADDFIDKDSFTAADYIINRCIKANPVLVSENKEKVLRLEYICENPTQKALYHKPPTAARREDIISRMLKETHQEVQESRLLTLITQALRYQAEHGLIVPQLALSLIENKQKALQVENEQFVSRVDKMLRYDEESRVTALQISNNGEYIAIGGIDGLIEIYEPLEYTLHTGLSYQADGVMLFHDDSIELMRFSEKDEMFVSVDIKGVTKIWNMQTGKLLRKIEYGSTVGCVCWGIEPSHLLLAHQTIRLYGVRSCNVLKQYSNSGDNSQEYLLSIHVTNGKVYSFSPNGTVRVYNYQTQQQMNSIHLKGGLIQVLPVFERANKLIGFLTCSNNSMVELDLQLGSTDKYYLEEQMTYHGMALGRNYLYECLGYEKEFKLRVRERKSHGQVNGKVVQTLKLESQAQIIELHHFRNLLLTYLQGDSLCFWRP